MEQAQPNPWEMTPEQLAPHAAPVAAPAAMPGLGGRPNLPPGYRAHGDALAPIPGGPADPTNAPPSGYRFRPDRTLEAIPGGPADHGGMAAPSDDPVIRAQARALVEGRIPYPTGRAAVDPRNQQIIATALQLDPNFDENAHAMRRAASLAFTGNGRGARTIGSARRIAHHLADLNAASERLAGPDLGVGAINTVAAALGQAVEPTDATTYDTAVGHIAQELQGYFRQGSGTGAEIERDIENMGRHQSLDSRRAAVHELISLIAGGVQPLQDQYNSAFRPGSPRPQIPWFNEQERRIYQDLGGVDFSVDQDNQSGPAGASGGNAAPPTVGGPPAPPAVRAGVIGAPGEGTAGVEAAQSDTPPEQAVSAHYLQLAQQAQALFNSGATRQEMDDWASHHGVPAFPPALDDAITYRNNGGRHARILPPETPTEAGVRAQQLGAIDGPAGYGQRARAGLTQGLNDEISGAASAVGNIVSSPFTGNFDPVGSYQVGRDAERIRNTEAQDATGGAGTAVEVGSGIIGALPAFVVAAPAEAGLGARMLAGARAGGAVGAGSGWAHGEGLGGSTRGALVGGVEGTAIGAAGPPVGAVARAGGRLVRGAYRTVIGENPDLSRRIIAQAIEADGNTPADAGAQMADAQAHGVPAMLADTGDNVRGLLAASARAPGPARTAARAAVDARQSGMADRVTGAIERDLGPVSNPHQVADAAMTQARDAAAPLYDSAYARPGADTFAQRVAPLLSRPSMQRALQRAARIAAEEGRDPSTTGFEVNSSGEVTVSRTPSWQTLDYVKRGLDDVIEGYRDPTSGRLNLDTEGRAINNTQRSFLAAFDRANPDYAAARAAYGGPVRGIDAMNAGRGALNMTADDLQARMRDMTPFERQMFQLGTRRAMAELVASRGDSADVVNALVGTGKKRAMLARLFGDRQSFQRFIDTLGHEQEAFRTYKTARLGSPTAVNIQDDNALRDAAAEGVTDVALNGPAGIPSAVARFLTSAGRRRADENTAKEVTALLSESDPARLHKLANELRLEQARQAAASARRARNARVGGVTAGEVGGNRRR